MGEVAPAFEIRPRQALAAEGFISSAALLDGSTTELAELIQLLPVAELLDDKGVLMATDDPRHGARHPLAMLPARVQLLSGPVTGAGGGSIESATQPSSDHGRTASKGSRPETAASGVQGGSRGTSVAGTVTAAADAGGGSPVVAGKRGSGIAK